MIDGTDHITGLNNNSRTKVGAYYRAWFVRVVKVRELGYDYTLMHYEADCSANRMRRLAFAAYKLDGSNEFGSSEIEPWEAIFPESIAEAMKDEVCNPALLEEPGFDNAKAFAQWGRASLLAD
ncbi:hypothetical protein SAMN02787020_2007 [Brevundimonas sp. 374]|nr:hypothetical protein SAMN02787020_2007 [Brevundimonas sp. 374]